MCARLSELSTAQFFPLYPHASSNEDMDLLPLLQDTRNDTDTEGGEGEERMLSGIALHSQRQGADRSGLHKIKSHAQVLPVPQRQSIGGSRLLFSI